MGISVGVTRLTRWLAHNFIMRSSLGHWGKSTGQATLRIFTITRGTIWQGYLLLALCHEFLLVEHMELGSLSAF